MKKGKIFIQIASYRDPQLVPTIKDCIEKAKNPKNLVLITFGIKILIAIVSLFKVKS